MTAESLPSDRPWLELSLRLPLERFVLEVEHRAHHRVLGVFGPSGSGKTSLLSAIAGLAPGATGSLRLGDQWLLDTAQDIDLPPESRRIGYVPQEGLLFPHLDVRGNLLAGSKRARATGVSIESTLSQVCDLLELEPLLSSDVSTLSGGERQRVALGRAICSGPRLLLLDEPLASLDRALRSRVLPFLQRTCVELDVPVILVSHDPIEVQALCQELLALRQGKVVVRGPTREVLADPRIFDRAGRDGWEEGFHNVLPCHVVETDGAVSEVALGGRDGVRLVTPRTEAPAGAELFVTVPDHEIILALSKPEGVSAQNVLPAEILSITEIGEQRLVTSSVSESGPPVTARITDRACAKLGLMAGQHIFLILKTASCRLLGG